MLRGAVSAGASLPSPLGGGGAETRSVEAGEGFETTSVDASDPSPGASLCSSPPSPTRGEGAEERGEVEEELGACASSRSQRYCATLVSWYSSTRMNLKRFWYCRSTSGCSRNRRIFSSNRSPKSA